MLNQSCDAQYVSARKRKGLIVMQLKDSKGRLSGQTAHFPVAMPRLSNTLLQTSLFAAVLAVSAMVLPAKAASKDQVEMADSLTKPYHAHYVLSRRGTERGEAQRVLEQKEDGQWRYFTSTRARLLVFSDRRENETFFRIEEGRVKPLIFDYSREGTGSNRALRVRFDYDNQEVVSEGGDDVNVEWHDGLLDPNAVLHQLQIDVAGDADSWTYPLVDESGDYRDYEFARHGTETLKLPFGEVEAIRVDRVRDHNRRQTLFWFAPELNYTLVKMQQIEDDREQLQIQLTDLDMN